MEIVQRRMELMSGEIEQMRRIKLFGDYHCSHILKTRREFEYKINGVTKNVQDFMDYIEYEKMLLETARFRRNSLKIGEKMGDIEHKIIKRIKELYETSLQRFKDDTTLWLAYFKFCKQVNYINAATVAISNMLKKHSHNVEIWQVATKWYAYDRKDIGSALKIICKGLTIHKDSKLLYKELVQLEVHNALSNGWQLKENISEPAEQQKLWLEKLCKYIKTIINNIKECEYYVELLEYLAEYNFTSPAQNIIIEFLMKNYSLRAITWKVIAQRDWKGLLNPMDNEPPATSTKTKLNKCINRYKEGLKTVTAEEKGILWSFYIDSLIDTRKEDHAVAMNFRTNCLKDALEQAFEDGYLSERYYIQWLDLVSDTEQLEILQKGVERYPQSIELWKLYLKTQILLDNKEGVQKVFKAGVDALKEKALPLWTGVIRYFLLSEDENVVEGVYEEGVKQPQEVSDFLKPHFLEWLAVTKGMRYTRQKYFALAKLEPYCKELHFTMSKLESTEIDFNFDSWDKVHELACEQFGKEDIEVWLNRLQYCTHYKKGKVTKTMLQQIYSEAQKALPDVLFINFDDKYNAMANNFKNVGVKQDI